VLKDGQPRELARAVRAAHAGEALLDPAVASRLVAAVVQAPAGGGGDGLTARELEVLAHIGGGLSNKRIARALGISESTVKAHVGHVLAKLGVAARTQAALHAQAQRAGLTRLPIAAPLWDVRCPHGADHPRRTPDLAR
jgi:DNA-binding NarL/FixJ family response regulator